MLCFGSNLRALRSCKFTCDCGVPFVAHLPSVVLNEDHCPHTVTAERRAAVTFSGRPWGVANQLTNDSLDDDSGTGSCVHAVQVDILSYRICPLPTTLSPSNQHDPELDCAIKRLDVGRCWLAREMAKRNGRRQPSLAWRLAGEGGCVGAAAGGGGGVAPRYQRKVSQLAADRGSVVAAPPLDKRRRKYDGIHQNARGFSGRSSWVVTAALEGTRATAGRLPGCWCV